MGMDTITLNAHNLTFTFYTVVPGQDQQKNNSKNKNRIFEKKNFQFFLHGEKEFFEEYSLNLTSVKLSFPILINYLAGKC
jgi:hypothetical protein